MICIQCGASLPRGATKYCSNRCQCDYQYNQYIHRWKRGEAKGDRDVGTKNISAHLRRYIFDKYGNKCSQCGWGQINKSTGLTPLEIDHIDGNYSNNSEENLRLLCPNCHSLTPSFKNLNKGIGRGWRRRRYIKDLK